MRPLEDDAIRCGRLKAKHFLCVFILVGDFVAGEADDACLAGGDGDCAVVECSICAMKCLKGGNAMAASKKTEILTGSDALRFLCASSVTADDAGYGKLFSNLNRKNNIASCTGNPLSPPTSSPRTQRKAYRPFRLPPPEQAVQVPSDEGSVVLQHSLLLSKTHDCRKENRIEIRNGGATNDSKLPSTGDGEKDKQHRPPSPQVCKNLACKAILHAEASFCKRCSCCICKEFDDNKDPSLWITCDRDEEGCGLSCHAECALQDEVAGVVEKDGSVWLDGGFLCKSCGKISSLVGLWRRQLLVAKEARRVDVLCLRLSLSLRLFGGTRKYKEAHSTLEDAVKKLEAELSLMKKDSTKLRRCIVKRLSCDAEVQELIDLSLKQAERVADAESAVVAAHLAVDAHASIDTLGYKVCHQKTTDDYYPAAPTFTIAKSSRKALVSDLQSCKSYTFRMSSFAAHGDGEEWEAECCTKETDSTLKENYANKTSIECAHRNTKYVCHGAKNSTANPKQNCTESESLEQASPDWHGSPPESQPNLEALLKSKTAEAKCDYRIKDIREMQEMHPFAVRMYTKNNFGGGATSNMEFEKARAGLCVSRDTFDDKRTNISDVCGTNLRSSGVSQSWAMQLHCSKAQRPMLTIPTEVDRQAFSKKMPCIEEFTIRLVRWLECQGHLHKDFRMKFLTWYSLRASEQEKRVVAIFIGTLQNNPGSLAAQLVDAFQETINSKRRRAAELTRYSRAYQQVGFTDKHCI